MIVIPLWEFQFYESSSSLKMLPNIYLKLKLTSRSILISFVSRHGHLWGIIIVELKELNFGKLLWLEKIDGISDASKFLSIVEYICLSCLNWLKRVYNLFMNCSRTKLLLFGFMPVKYHFANSSWSRGPFSLKLIRSQIVISFSIGAFNFKWCEITRITLSLKQSST